MAMGLVNIGSGQGAFTIEQQALALIVALGGKKETAENIKAFSDARQEAEKVLSAMMQERSDLDEYKKSLEERDKDLSLRSDELGRLESEHNDRIKDLDLRVHSFEETRVTVETDLKFRLEQLEGEKNEFEEKCKQRSKELNVKEGKIDRTLKAAEKAEAKVTEKLAKLEDKLTKMENTKRQMMALLEEGS